MNAPRTERKTVLETVAQFSVFTGFWTIAYFFMVLSALALARRDGRFVVEVVPTLQWFGTYLAFSLLVGNIIGLVDRQVRPDRFSGAHNQFGSDLKNPAQRIAGLVFAGIISGISFLAVAVGSGWASRAVFGITLAILDNVSWPWAVAAVSAASVTVGGLVALIVAYVSEQFESFLERRIDERRGNNSGTSV